MLVIKLFKIRFLEKLVVIGSVTVLVLLAGTGFADADIAKKSEPQVQVVSLAVSPKEADAGIPVTIIIGVKNSDSESAEYSIPIVVQEKELEVISGILPSGSSRRHLVRTVQNNPDLYSVSVRGLTDSFRIMEEQFTGRIESVFPSIVDPGGTTLIEGVITNDGGISGVHESTVFLDGIPVKELTGVLLPQETNAFSFGIQVENPGVHVVSVGNSSFSFLSLSPLLEAKIPQSVPISKYRTVALDSNGKQVSISGNNILLNTGSGRLGTVDFPLHLSSENSLASVFDIATGIKYQNRELLIPLENKTGNGEISLRLLLDSLSVSGNRIIGQIETFSIEFKDISVNLEIIEQGIGTINFEGKMVPESLPIGSSIQIKATKNLDPILRENLNRSLSGSGDQIGALALGIDLVTKETEQPLSLKSGSLQFAINSSWVERFSEESSIKVVVVNPSYPELLNAKKIEFDHENRVIFGTTVHSGTSKFRIVTLIHPRFLGKEVVGSIRFNPQAGAPGDVVEIIGGLINESKGMGQIPVSLYKGNQLIRTKMINSENDASETIRFFLELTQEGSYSIGLNGTSEQLLIAPPLNADDVLVTAVVPSATTVQAGSPLTLSISVSNQGDETGLALPMLRINNAQARITPVVLEPGESKIVTTQIILGEPGSYWFVVGKLGVSVGVFPPSQEDVFSIDEVIIHPKVLDPGETAILQMELTNSGYVESEFSGQGTIGPNKFSVGPISVPALTTILVRKELIVFESGIQKGNLDGHAFQIEIRRAKETNFEVSNLSVSPTNAKKDQLISVTATLSNSLAVLGKDEITLKVDGMIISSEWAWLGPGESKDVAFEIAESELGSHFVSVNGVEIPFKIERMIPLIVLIPLGIFGILGGIVGVYFGRRQWGRIPSVFQLKKTTGE